MSATYSLVSAATTNLTSAVNVFATLRGYSIRNTAAYTVYVRIYDKATAPVPASDVPVLRFAIPAAGLQELMMNFPVWFKNGIAFDITKASGDTDTTAVAAGDVTMNLFYE